MSKFFLFMYIIVSIFFTNKLYATQKNHFTIAIDPEYIPFTQKDIDGNPTGLLVDFWNLWAKANHYTVSYKFYPWEETLTATKNSEVDFHSGTTKDREWMHASNPIYELSTGLFVVKESSIALPYDLRTKRIGTIDSYYGELVQEVVGDDVKIILYDDYGPLVEALKNNQIDALVDDIEAIRYYLIKTGEMNRFKMIENEQLRFTNSIFAITNPQNAHFLPLINQGWDKLNLMNLVDAEKVWLPRIDTAYYNRQLLSKIRFTDDEKRWLKLQKSLSITGDPVWIENVDCDVKCMYRGVSGDYIKSIAEKLETNLTTYTVESWAELLATSPDEHVDIIMGIMNEKLKNLLSENYTFLQPYEAGPLVMIMNKDVRFITELYDISDKRVGVLSLQAYTNALEYKYDEYAFHYFPKVKILLQKLLDDEVSVAILPLPDAILALSNPLYESLDIVGKMDAKAYVNIGIKKGEYYLENIMRKVLISTQMHYRQSILSKWTHKLNYVEKIDYEYTYKIASALIALLIFLAGYAWILRRKHQYEYQGKKAMKEIARTDGLTELYNKREFNYDFSQNHEDKTTLTLLFIDVDFFKKYNDYYGHLSGDRTLQEIAHILKRFTSEYVHPYRIGGEEFGVLLYNYTPQEAIEFATQLRVCVYEEKIEHIQSNFGYVTVSIGIASGEYFVNRQRLYTIADKALYKAKEAGRNKVQYLPYSV